MNKTELCAHAPITYEMTVRAFGGEPNLNNDAERAAFFAVWALLCREWAEAIIGEEHRALKPEPEAVSWVTTDDNRATVKLGSRILEYPFTTRTKNCLRNDGIVTAADLLRCQNIHHIPNFGLKSAYEMLRYLGCPIKGDETFGILRDKLSMRRLELLGEELGHGLVRRPMIGSLNIGRAHVQSFVPPPPVRDL